MPHFESEFFELKSGLLGRLNCHEISYRGRFVMFLDLITTLQ